MNKQKQTPADQAGDRTQRQPRDPGPDRKPDWTPADDIYGDGSKPVDADLDLDKGKHSDPPPKA